MFLELPSPWLDKRDFEFGASNHAEQEKALTWFQQ
jgi:hypothetical protein